MNNEQYQDIKRQVLMVASLTQQLEHSDLVGVMDYLEKSATMAIGDRKGLNEIQGDTELLKFIIIRLLDIKSVLPEPRGNGDKRHGG